MIALDIDVKTAQTRGGHRNAKTTLDIYVRPLTQQTGRRRSGWGPVPWG
jgi:integrase